MHCAKTPEPKKISSDCQGLRVKGKNWLQRGHGGNLGMAGLFYILTVVVVTSLPTFQNSQKYKLKRVNLTVHKLYLNRKKKVLGDSKTLCKKDYKHIKCYWGIYYLAFC